MMGQRDYSMRIWVDPDKLAARSLTASDVVNAMREQNTAGGFGQDRAGTDPPGAEDADHADHARPAGGAGTVRQYDPPHDRPTAG